MTNIFWFYSGSSKEIAGYQHEIVKKLLERLGDWESPPVVFYERKLKRGCGSVSEEMVMVIGPCREASASLFVKSGLYSIRL